uniref:Uncharacterized protein n=1 Tax=Heterorhabditis bacteriophora TaxID=37862 RepID=A0A1I7XH28_HETBA
MSRHPPPPPPKPKGYQLPAVPAFSHNNHTDGEIIPLKRTMRRFMVIWILCTIHLSRCVIAVIVEKRTYHKRNIPKVVRLI